MSDNPQGTGEISLNDAVSLLNTPPEDTVAEEQVEAIAPQPPEDESIRAGGGYRRRGDLGRRDWRGRRR